MGVGDLPRAVGAKGWQAVDGIEHIQEVPGDPLGGASGAKRFRVLFVGKQATEKYPYQVVNDRVASEIGRTLGLWVPDSVIYPVAGEYLFFSHFVEYRPETASGETRPPRPSDDHEAALVSPGRSSFRHGVVMFDLFVANNDRKPDNIVMDTHGRLWLIDHGNALLYRPYTAHGDSRPGGALRLAAVRADLAAMFDRQHHFLKWLTDWDEVRLWAARIAALPEYFIRHLVEALPAPLLANDERQALVEFLIDRRGRMLDVVEQHHALFPSLPSAGA